MDDNTLIESSFSATINALMARTRGALANATRTGQNGTRNTRSPNKLDSRRHGKRQRTFSR